MTDGIAREGLVRAARSLRRAYYDGSDVEARADMCVASLCGGLALANAKLGAVHGFAAPLGGMFPIPHGVACARLLAPVAEANVRALAERRGSGSSYLRYEELTRILVPDPHADTFAGVAALHSLVEELKVPRLSAYGVRSEDVAAVVEQAKRASSMQGNPVELTDVELVGALEAAL